MKVQQPQIASKPIYPMLAKVAALVAVSCAVSSCQKQPEPAFPTGGVIRIDKK